MKKMNVATRQCLKELESLNLDRNSQEYQYLRKMVYVSTLVEFQKVYNKELHKKTTNLFNPVKSKLWGKIAGFKLTISWIEGKGSQWFLEECLKESICKI